MSDPSPAGARGAWRAFTAWYAWLLAWLLVVAIAILVIPVSMQIFSRFTALIPHYIWTEEMARFLFIWMIMIGSAVAVREGAHFDVDVWPRLGARANAALTLVAGLAILVMALVFVWAGIEFTRFAWNRISELAELPLWLIHVAWPFAGASWVVFIGERMFDALRVLLGREAAT